MITCTKVTVIKQLRVRVSGGKLFSRCDCFSYGHDDLYSAYTSMDVVICFLLVCLTHGLWPPDEVSMSVSTDGIRVIRHLRIQVFEAFFVVWAVDQHSIHHFLFVQRRSENTHTGLLPRTKLKRKKCFSGKLTETVSINYQPEAQNMDQQH